MKRATLIRIVSTAALMLALAPTVRAAGPVQACQLAKLKAAAKKLGAKMSCVAKGKIKSVTVDPACFAKAEAKFSAAFTKAGSVCPGTAAGIETLVDDCVGILTGDVPGDGKCPATKAKAGGKAAAGELGCAQKEIIKPGTFAACDAKSVGKLGADLAKAGSCPDSGTLSADVEDCRVQIVAALPATTTTSTTTSSSTTTSTVPTCGNAVVDPGEQCDGDPGPFCHDAAVFLACGLPGTPRECQCCATQDCVGPFYNVHYPCCGDNVCVVTGDGSGMCLPPSCTVPTDCPAPFTCAGSQCCVPSGAFCGNPIACGLCCNGSAGFVCQ